MSEIDLSRPVQVYRNLHKGMWSVRQDGKVKAHLPRLILKDVEFRVGAKGRERVRREHRKNVHAYVKGKICRWSDIEPPIRWMCGVSYNPYENETFVKTSDNSVVKSADYCRMDINAQRKLLALWRSKPNDVFSTIA